MDDVGARIAKLEELTTRLKDSETELDKERRRLKIFNRIIVAANESENQKELVQSILDTAIDLLHFDVGAIYLVQGGKARVVATHSVGNPGIDFFDKICLQNEIYQEKFSKGKSLLFKNYDKTDPVLSGLLGGIKTLVSVPIIFNKQLKGCINVGSILDGDVPSEDCEIIRTLGKHLAHVLHRLETELELEGQFIEVAAYTQELKATEDELRKNLSELEEKKNYLDALFYSLPVPIFYKTTDGIYRDCNPAFCAAYGADKDYIVGKNAEQLYPEYYKDFNQKDHELICKGGVQQYLHEIFDKDYKTHNALIVKTLHHDINDNIIGIIGCIVDVSPALGLVSHVMGV